MKTITECALNLIVTEEVTQTSTYNSTSTSSTVGVTNTPASKANNASQRNAKKLQRQRYLDGINKQRQAIKDNARRQVKQINSINRTIKRSITRDTNIPKETKMMQRETQYNARQNRLDQLRKSTKQKLDALRDQKERNY